MARCDHFQLSTSGMISAPFVPLCHLEIISSVRGLAAIVHRCSRWTPDLDTGVNGHYFLFPVTYARAKLLRAVSKHIVCPGKEWQDSSFRFPSSACPPQSASWSRQTPLREILPETALESFTLCPQHFYKIRMRNFLFFVQHH
jgi:hypothetical protein